MIFLDTNVLSELLRARPEPSVLTWLDSRPATKVATTAITAAELFHGARRLPAGARKTTLTESIRAMFDEDFHGRVIPFDASAAREYAHVVCDRTDRGQPISVPDAQIAALCRTHHATLATRNIKDFTDTGIDLVDPWQAT